MQMMQGGHQRRPVVGGDPWKACKVFVLDHIRQNMVFQIENEVG
jgi:hypothetical protein